MFHAHEVRKEYGAALEVKCPEPSAEEKYSLEVRAVQIPPYAK